MGFRMFIFSQIEQEPDKTGQDPESDVKRIRHFLVYN